MKNRKRVLPGLVLIGLPLALYTPLLFGGKVLYWGVYLLQFYPWRQLAVEQIRTGHWPLWNPYLGAGTPLAANLQTAAFYPFNVLFLFMSAERAFGWELALHLALAGLCAYYLGRTLRLGRFGALVTGLTYGGGGYLVARWVFPSMVYAAAWLPLMLALTERLISNIQCPIFHSKGIGYWVLDIGLLALAIALQLLAGHAQTSFYSLLIVAAFALARLAHHAPRITRRITLATCSLLLATLWGVALAAIQLLPSIELAANSQRGGTLTDLQFAYELSFWPWRLISLLAPDFFGNPARDGYWAYGTYWEEAAYTGILPLILAILAIAAWRQHCRDKTEAQGPLVLVPFLVLVSFLSVVAAMGDHTPLYPLIFRYVPGFGLFQAPARLMLGYAMGVALLAGIGADTLRLTSRSRTTLKLTVMIGLGIGIAGAFAWLALPTIRSSFSQSAARLGLTLVLALKLLLLRGHRLRRNPWQALVIGFVAADLMAFGWGLAPGTDPAAYNTPINSAEFLDSQPPGRVFVAYPYAQEMYDEFVSLHSFGPADPAYVQGLREGLLPNLNSVPHLSGVGNYDPLTIGVYHDLWEQIERDRDSRPTLEEIRPLLNLFGARYVVSDKVYGQPDLSLIYEEGPYIYRNDAALPDAFVVSRARVVRDPETRITTLLDPAFDPRAEVLLNHSPTASLTAEKRLESEPVSQAKPSVWREGPDRVSVQVSMARPGYLVLTDTYYPGWRARIDGQPAEILPANHAFRAVELSTGEHSVVFEYSPFSFRLGAWITGGTALLLAAILLVSRFSTGARSQIWLQTDDSTDPGGNDAWFRRRRPQSVENAPLPAAVASDLHSRPKWLQ